MTQSITNTLNQPMVVETASTVKSLMQELYDNNFIDEMTMKLLLQTPEPRRIPEFYTLTKIHKPKPVGRPIVSGCSGPTELISAFLDKLLQPVAQSQKSYIKDRTDFINFIERKKYSRNVLLVTLDVTSLYTNIPQAEGIQVVCDAYAEFYKEKPPIPTQYVKSLLKLILEEISFKFNNTHWLQSCGCTMGTKVMVAFSNIFMAKIEEQILERSQLKPLDWKRFIDDIAFIWEATIQEVEEFIKEANHFHPTIKFTAEISDTRATFLDTTLFKGARFKQL